MVGEQEQKIKSFIEKAREIHGNKYDYSLVTHVKTREKSKIVCPEHGRFEQYAYAHLRGQGCPKCARLRNTDTTEKFKQKAFAVHGNKYDYKKTVYGANQREKVTITCPEHGDFTQSPTDHLSGKGCKLCGHKSCKQKQTFDIGRSISDFRKIHGLKYTYPNLETEYKRSTSMITVVCPKHGKFKKRANLHKHGQGCPNCASDCRTALQTLRYDDVIRSCKLIHENRYSYEPDCDPERLASSHSVLNIVCPKHGTFQQKVMNHKIQAQGCPKCTHKVSKPEKELFRFLLECGLNDREIIRSDRSRLCGKELDLWIPGNNLAIEFNGTYWHNDLKKPRKYHQDKVIECRKNGVHLIHVYEWEWNLRRPQIKYFLKNIVCKADRRIPARKTHIKELDKQQEDRFFDDYHIQSNIPGSSIRAGLFLKDELLAAITFGKPRFNKSRYKYELYRLCFKPGCQIIGGTEKLWKWFLWNHTKAGDAVLSYASLDLSYGNVYPRLGFRKNHISPPNYRWVKSNESLTRYQTQKHKLSLLLPEFDEKKSEAENMRDNGYFRVFDSGNIVYEYSV